MKFTFYSFFYVMLWQSIIDKNTKVEKGQSSTTVTPTSTEKELMALEAMKISNKNLYWLVYIINRAYCVCNSSKRKWRRYLTMWTPHFVDICTDSTHLFLFSEWHISIHWSPWWLCGLSDQTTTSKSHKGPSTYFITSHLSPEIHINKEIPLKAKRISHNITQHTYTEPNKVQKNV